ncbi:MAG TPA: iron-containing alcohol dehydrogenase [Jatrophihabitans sp.]|jgi:alcohol dehydrogenase class IV|uniref:iron-containing alcohol dehydrogenase n=1 Tax=Jatrophihabitans sp. TaxID=1932789 RepID=UPI002DF97018|nr:iron-containing alcohol dehydrogenase [Jatrophihabitans sp.]
MPPLAALERRSGHVHEAAGGPQGAPTGVIKFQAPEVVFGAGSLREAGFAARRLGARRPFVVTDAGLIEAGWVTQLVDHLSGAGLSATVWSGVTPNPKDHEVTQGYERYRESGCDVLIAIGGGSCIDAAKGIAILTGNGGSILDYAGVDRVTRAIPPLLMIPTTAGTGADVSQFCIITDTVNAVKVTIMGRALVPDISLTDPDLLTTMPDDLAAATGLDALTHGIEAFVSRAHNPLTDGHALSAVRLVFGNLAEMIDRPEVAAHRENMAQASLEAGLAFSNAILGATHAMSHQVGGLLDLPHGVVNGVLLPHVIRFNAAVAGDRFVPLAAMAGLHGGSDEVGDVLADEVRSVADRLGVPKGLSQLGVTEADIPTLAANAMVDACLSTNPRPVEVDDLAALFRAAL